MDADNESDVSFEQFDDSDADRDYVVSHSSSGSDNEIQNETPKVGRKRARNEKNQTKIKKQKDSGQASKMYRGKGRDVPQKQCGGACHCKMKCFEKVSPNTRQKIYSEFWGLAVLGDNLGSHQIGGFSENFSSCSYVCRYCYIKTENINTQFFGLQKRTKESYEIDVQIQLMANETHHRGVKSNSILNNLNFFHVCNPGLPPCVAHDIFEGVVQYDLALAINHFIQRKIFTIDILNERLRQLKLDDGETIPKFLFKKNLEKLPGSAHENIIFIMLLPFALYDLFVDCCDEVWKMILKWE